MKILPFTGNSLSEQEVETTVGLYSAGMSPDIVDETALNFRKPSNKCSMRE